MDDIYLKLVEEQKFCNSHPKITAQEIADKIHTDMIKNALDSIDSLQASINRLWGAIGLISVLILACFFKLMTT